MDVEGNAQELWLACANRGRARPLERSDGIELMQRAATHIDTLALRLVSLGTERIALVGGLVAQIERWLAGATKGGLVPPVGDAVDGALRVARTAADMAPERDRFSASAGGI